MAEELKCPKCGGRIEEGELAARWTGVRDLGVYFKNESRKPVIAYACKKCGYIELYREMELKDSR